MPNLLDHFNRKEPRYPNRYRELIDNRTAVAAFPQTGL